MNSVTGADAKDAGLAADSGAVLEEKARGEGR